MGSIDIMLGEIFLTCLIIWLVLVVFTIELKNWKERFIVILGTIIFLVGLYYYG
jgi:hypothetical protein